ncbi:MAG: hypothetical protein V8Q84_00805, partial [Bilophila sp.]
AARLGTGPCCDVEACTRRAGRPPNACHLSLLPWLRFTGLARVQAASPPPLPAHHVRQAVPAGGEGCPLPLAVPCTTQPRTAAAYPGWSKRHAGPSQHR